MTKEEAAVVAAIVSTADGGCSVCGDQLAEQLAKHFPIDGFDWRRTVFQCREEQL